MDKQAVIDSYDKAAENIKGKLEELIDQYIKIKESGGANDILDLKDKFVALDYRIGNATVKACNLAVTSDIERREAYNLAFINARSDYEPPAKKPSIDDCETKAWLETAEYVALQTQADSIHKNLKHFQSVCSNYITQLSQRIKGLQSEMINSHQSS